MAKKAYIGVKSRKIKLTNIAPTINGRTGFNNGSASSTHTKYAASSLMLTGNTSVIEVTATTTTTFPLIKGHKYYARVEIYQESVVGSSDFYWPIAEPSFCAGKVATAGKWTIISATSTRSSWDSGRYQLRLDFNNVNNAGYMWFDGLMLIDLTEAFGEGNEPYAEWMNKNVPYFKDSLEIEKKTSEGVARKIKKMYIGDPSVYTIVDFIQSSGTQYIDTGFKPTGGTKVVCDFQMVNQGTSQQGVFGSRPGSSGRFTVFTGQSGASDLQVDYNTEQTLATVGNAITGLDINDRTVMEVSNSLIINGNTIKTVSAASFTSSYNLFLFANNNAGSVQLPGSMKLYSFQIYDNGTLARDYVPCIDYNGAIGLYDRVSKQFYANKGTGEFTAGTKTGKTEGGEIARRIKKAYIGIGGVARPCWGGGKMSYYGVITPLSTARDLLAATTIGDYALFGGGRTGSYTSSAVVDAYNSSLTRSTPIALSSDRYGLTATTIGNYALFAGGWCDGPETPVSVVNAYNSSLSSSIPTSLSINRQDLASTSVGGYALFGGGYTFPNGISSVVDAYDPSLTRTIPTQLSANRQYLSAATIGDYALFGGGASPTDSYAVDAYNSSLTRTIPEKLSMINMQGAATTVGRYALFAGGRTSTNSNACNSVVNAYDSSLTRTIPDNMYIGRYMLSATSISDYALFGGGLTALGDIAGVVDAYDGSLTRTQPTSLNKQRYQLASTSIGNYALFGGGNTNSYSSVVDAYTIV